MDTRRITCVGALNVDQVLHVPHIVRAGETLGVVGLGLGEAGTAVEGLGGKGANQAVAVLRVGCLVCLLSSRWL
jgi:sugar/nucleoside kinase (ribokinase family)